jgi:hypothetical protein
MLLNSNTHVRASCRSALQSLLCFSPSFIPFHYLLFFVYPHTVVFTLHLIHRFLTIYHVQWWAMPLISGQGRDTPKPSTTQIYYIFIYYIFSYGCNFI